MAFRPRIRNYGDVCRAVSAEKEKNMLKTKNPPHFYGGFFYYLKKSR